MRSVCFRTALALSRFSRQSSICHIRSCYQLCSSASCIQPATENISSDFSTLERLWTQSTQTNVLSQFLFQKFASEKNTFSYALSLVSHSVETHALRNYALAFEILLAFAQWLSKNSTEEEKLTLELKQQAMQIALSVREKSVTQMICDVFKLCQDKESLKVHAEKCIDQGSLVEASLCVTLLGIQDEIPIEKIVLPLIFENKSGAAVRYLTGHPELQVCVAKKLDGIICRANLDSFIRYGNRRLDVRILCKNLTTLLRVFGLDPELCPSLHRAKGFGTLNFLLRKRLENPHSSNHIDDKIVSMCCEPELQKALLCKLVSVSDLKSAYKFAKILNIPKEEWPQELLIKEETLSDCVSNDNVVERKSPASKQSTDFLTLELDKSAVKFVTTEDEFVSCLDDITQNHNHVVGVDSEWKPHFSKSEKARLSLMQLAVNDKVYILDMLSLDSCLHTHHWNRLMEGLFANPEIIKLGCGIMQDVQMLLDDYKGTKDRVIRFSHIVDVSFLYEKLSSLYEEILDEDAYISGMKGLSKLCEIIFGKPLNKKVRFCDWEERPLSESQIMYAALDANCLIEMFKKLRLRCIEYGWNFEHYVNVAMVMTTSMAKVVKTRRSFMLVQEHQSFYFTPIKQIKDLKVAVDPTLKSLAVQLRMFGADVVILCDGELEGDGKTLDDADREGRILICKEGFIKEDEFPEERLYIIGNSDLSQCTPARIFKHFNVKVAKQAILSRCMECNNSEFLRIPADYLQELWNRRSAAADSVTYSSESKELSWTCDNEHVNSDGFLSNGVQIQLDKLEPGVFSHENYFNICKNCGYVSSQS